MVEFGLDTGNGILDGPADIQGLENGLGKVGKAVDFVDDLVELIDFCSDLFAEFGAEISVVVSLTA